MAKSNHKHLLSLGVALNLMLLGYFKYRGFFVEQINELGFSLPVPELILPLGLSFFVFQKISFLLDVRSSKNEPPKSITDYLLYIALFPQLVAGPIIQFNQIAEQLKSRTHSSQQVLDGLWLFALGLSQKVLIADPLGQIVNEISAQPNTTHLTLIFALLCFALQIYMDFSGYSRMAIGLAKIFGFNFPANFNYPYLATSVSDFWRRWHMTLSDFFKTYAYIPLGGNRKGLTRTCLHILIVFLLTGLWHGAAWHFVLWGMYFGILLCAERIYQHFQLPILPKIFRFLTTFLLVLFGWALFIWDKIPTTIIWQNQLSIIHLGNYELLVFFLGWIFAFCNYKNILALNNFVKMSLILLLFSLSIGMISTKSVTSFLYFQF